jgi:hypothetical protein
MHMIQPHYEGAGRVKPPAEPPPIPSNWQRLKHTMQMGRSCDELAQPFLERLAGTTCLGQDNVDPPVPGRTVESASYRGAYYVMLNILSERGIIAFRKAMLLTVSLACPPRHTFGSA